MILQDELAGNNIMIEANLIFTLYYVQNIILVFNGQGEMIFG
jgi:hypothetical protein